MTELRTAPYSLRTVEGVIYLLYPTGEATGLKWETSDQAAAEAELARYNSKPRATLTDAERAYLAAHPDDQGAIPEGQEPVQPKPADPRAAAFDAKYDRGPNRSATTQAPILDPVDAGILDSLDHAAILDIPERVNGPTPLLPDEWHALGLAVLREFGARGLQKVIHAAKTKAKELEQS